MLKVFLISVLVCISFNFFAQVSLYVDEIEHEGYVGDEDFTGFTTYRVFVQLESPNDAIKSIGQSGMGNFQNTISSSSVFYQSEFVGPSSNSQNSILNQLFPAYEYDSYFSIGKKITNQQAVPFTDNEDGFIENLLTYQMIILDDENTWINQFEQGGAIEFIASEGSWFTNSFPTGGLPAGENNSVFIGQFTTEGILDISISVVLEEDISEYDQFSAFAVLLDGSYGGCDDVNACNYNPNNLNEPDECVYVNSPCNDLDNETLNTVLNENCECEEGTLGCTDPLYLEFNPYAHFDDGTCSTLLVYGCVYNGALNFDLMANKDDGSCIFSSTSACPADLSEDGMVTVADLSLFLGLFGTSCD